MVRWEIFLPSPRRQHFLEKFFRCPFQYPKVPLEAGAPPPPQSFDASYAPAWQCLHVNLTDKAFDR
jgi:hypothetical protein